MEILSNDGRFKGILNEGVRVFRGITFATYERFEPAEPVEYTEGVADAAGYGCVCPQRSDRVMGEEKGARIEEGRLCLSVYTPETGENLPVMVWIHGGSFLTGGSEEKRYGCERLVNAGNVVVIKISYRLGALGFLYMPEKGIENLGLKDQQLALDWIRRYAPSFGGDPKRVTIFGQSAGALSIGAIISGCGENPPFCKAIIQSSPFGIKSSPKAASVVTRKFLRKLGKDPMAASLDEILDAQEYVSESVSGLSFMPIVDSFTAIPQAVSSSGMKILSGCTKHDASPFVRGSLGKLFDSFIGRCVIAAVTKIIFSNPNRKYVLSLRKAGVEAAEYLFSWHPKGSPYGACHCIELPFLLGEYDDWCEAPMLAGMSREEYESNSRLLLSAWVGFANDGVFPEL